MFLLAPQLLRAPPDLPEGRAGSLEPSTWPHRTDVGVSRTLKSAPRTPHQPHRVLEEQPGIAPAPIASPRPDPARGTRPRPARTVLPWERPVPAELREDGPGPRTPRPQVRKTVGGFKGTL